MERSKSNDRQGGKRTRNYAIVGIESDGGGNFAELKRHEIIARIQQRKNK